MMMIINVFVTRLSVTRSVYQFSILMYNNVDTMPLCEETCRRAFFNIKIIVHLIRGGAKYSSKTAAKQQ